MKKYDHKKIEKKWQTAWEKKKVYRTLNNSKKKKFYILDMFPYVSGEGIHVGHPKGYIATDVVSRMKRMQGFNVLHPMGFDAFGLPAENYAIKTKTNPVVSVAKNIDRFKKQLKIIGFDYDWTREVNTSDPKFYKWTQWIFLKLLERGLAFESNEPVNWCPKDKTVLANEDVEDGKCERCGTFVEKRSIRQWVLKITDYADRLLADLDGLDWPESIKESQRNWIGRSEGIMWKQKIKDLNIPIECYDSVPQTFMAQTFCVIAPEHPLVKKLIEGTKYEKPVLSFIEKFIQRKNKDAFGAQNEVEGIFTGRYVENPFGTGDLPIWIATFVVADYGTGIVNSSAHDERDFAFAKKYNIPLRPVFFPKDLIQAKKVRNLEFCYQREPQGVLEEPKEFKGREWSLVREDIIDYVVKKGFGYKKVNYKLRDWVFSRQRYWGEPIPILRDGEKIIPVPEKDLPVTLPKVKSYEPTGTAESPLVSVPSWINVPTFVKISAGKKIKKILRREDNTMPQWAGSSWYYLRYMDPKNAKALVDKKIEKYWNMVDLYVGGAEHATRHLIYARFWHKFLYDIGVVKNKEPFKKLQHVGLIMASDGRKMSKRFGNIVNPDTVISTFGADSLRIYEMFMGPFDQTVAWSTDSIIGPRRFLERVWKIGDNLSKSSSPLVVKTLHRTIKKVSEDIGAMRFNTAVSSLMMLVNEMNIGQTSLQDYKKFLQILSPFAPHITEELWMNLGEKKSINFSKWPNWDSKMLKDEEIKLMIQVNGKVRSELMINVDETEDNIKEKALQNKAIKKYVTQGIRKVIYVKNRLVNVVT